jgi:hypothetical protein
MKVFAVAIKLKKKDRQEGQFIGSILQQKNVFVLAAKLILQKYKQKKLLVTQIRQIRKQQFCFEKKCSKYEKTICG